MTLPQEKSAPLPGEVLADLLEIVGEIAGVLEPDELFHAIAQRLRRIVDEVVNHPPVPPPLLNTAENGDTPPDYVRLLWLNELPGLLKEDLPVKDLTGWLTGKFPEKGTADALLGLSKLLFDQKLNVEFKGGNPREYRTRDGALEASTIAITKP